MALLGNKQLTVKWGGCLSFDGVNDYVDAGSGASLSPNVFSITMWVNVNTISTQNFMARKAESPYKGWAFYFDPGGRPGFDYFYGDGTSALSQSFISTPVISSGTWYSISVVVNNGSSVQFYLNGYPSGQGVPTQSFIYPPNALRLGSSQSGYYGGYANGKLDDVRIYNRALSAAEVLAIYNSTR